MSIHRAALGEQIILAAADATTMNSEVVFGTPAFDRIFISYTLSMIPKWRDVVIHTAQNLAAEGALHIVDFGNFSGYPAWMASLQRAWLRAFSVVPIPNMEKELSTIAKELKLQAATTHLYGGYAVLTRLHS
jgi:S-adenosylmethionine-diacylgycerolhomoserine-N-methlytransferase